MNREQFKEIAISLKLKPTAEVLNSLENEFISIERSFENLRSINIEGVKPLSHMSIKTIQFDDLREDIATYDELLTKNQILENATQKDKDFVKIEKVVK